MTPESVNGILYDYEQTLNSLIESPEKTYKIAALDYLKTRFGYTPPNPHRKDELKIEAPTNTTKVFTAPIDDITVPLKEAQTNNVNTL